MRAIFLCKGLTKLNSTYQNFARLQSLIPPSPSDKHSRPLCPNLQIFPFFCIFAAIPKPAKNETAAKKAAVLCF